jgi:hypothetical protein
MRSYNKKAWTYAIIVTFILFFCTFSFAQTENIKGVQFKDGSIVYGKVIKMNIYDIQIETKDGNIISRKFDDVDVFIKDTGVDAKAEVEQAPVAEKVSQDKPAVSSKSSDVSGVKQQSSAFELGFMYYNFDYKEDMIAPQKSTENGWLPGVYFGYTFKKKSVIYAKAHIKYAAADIEYDGATLSGTPLKYSNQSAKMLKVEADVGYPISITKDFTLIPYTGYSYNYWQRGESKLVSPSATWTKEVYQWHNIPVGIKVDYDLNEKWNLSGSAAANFMFYGKMTLFASETYAGVPDFDFTLGNNVGFYAEMPITYKFTNNWSIVATPWYEYSAFGQSETQYYIYGGWLISVYEPSSKTNKYGINLGVQFIF